MLRSLSICCLFLAGCSLQHATRNPSGEDDHMAHMQTADLAAPLSRAARSGAEQGSPTLPPSNDEAPARLAASPRHGEWVKIAYQPGSPDSLMAWVVYPASRQKAPVVVVVHEIFGLSTWIRGVTDQVAAEGYIAIAPDFLSRVRGGPSSEEISGDSARRLIAGVNGTERNQVIVAAANWAMQQPAALQKYAVIGYCWGGSTVWMHAISQGVMGFVGGVAYYGLPYTSGGSPATATQAAVPATIVADSIRKIEKPVLLLSGSKDARITAAMPGLDSMMKAMGKTYNGINYEDATHGFLARRNDAAKEADIAATRDAWPRTVAFLKKNLGGK